MSGTEIEDSPLKSRNVTTSARKKLIDTLVDRDTKELKKQLKDTEARLHRVLAIYLATAELKTFDARQARTPALARYHVARRDLKSGDLKLTDDEAAAVIAFLQSHLRRGARQ